MTLKETPVDSGQPGSKFLNALTPEEREEYETQTLYAQYLLEKGWEEMLAPEFAKGKSLGHGQAIYSEYLARANEIGALNGSPWVSKREYAQQLDFEFDLIYKAGFVRYFLIVADLCRHAIEADIPFNARGSVNASLVAYLLHIGSLDPLRHGLLFFEFLNEDRIETGALPDIDIDFADDRTAEVFAYLQRTYGEEYVCRIGTHTRFRGALALQDVARAYEVPGADTLAITPLLKHAAKGDERADHTIEDSLTVSAVADYAERYPKVVEIARQFEGQVRGGGVHAAGVVISPVPIPDVLPVARRSETGKKGGTLATAVEMTEIEALGFVKIDALGLRSLRYLRNTFDVVRDRHDPEYCDCVGCERAKELEINGFLKSGNFYRFQRSLPLEDPAVMAMLNAGHCYGLMQLETSGMTGLVRKMQPTCFSQIADANALYRPGALRAGAVDHYLRRMRGEEPVPRIHPIYDRVTATTYAEIVYQGQIVELVHDLGGFSWSEAGKLQKIVAKSKGKEQFLQYLPRFVEGAVANGCREEVAKAIFTKMSEAGSYAFKRAHSVAYSLLACKQGWFKAYYPAEFLCAALKSTQRMDKVYGFVREAKRLGIPVKAPDVNASKVGFTIRGSGKDVHLRAGFESIEGVGPKAAETIVRAQESGPPFTDLENFLGRVEKRVVNKTVVKTLVDATAFESLHPNSWYLSTVLSNGKYPLAKEKRSASALIAIKNHLEIATISSNQAKMRGVHEWRIRSQAKLLTIPPEESLVTCYEHVWKRIHPDHKLTTFDEIVEGREYPSLIVKCVVTGLVENSYDNDSEEEEAPVQTGARVGLEDGTGYVVASVSPALYELRKMEFEKIEGQVIVARLAKRAGSDRMELTNFVLADGFWPHFSFAKYLINPPFVIDPRIKKYFGAIGIGEIAADWTRYDQRQVKICGRLLSSDVRHTKDGRPFANAVVEEDGHTARLTIWSGVYNDCKDLLEYETMPAIGVRGRVVPPSRYYENWQIELSERRGDLVIPVVALEAEIAKKEKKNERSVGRHR